MYQLKLDGHIVVTAGWTRGSPKYPPISDISMELGLDSCQTFNSSCPCTMKLGHGVNTRSICWSWRPLLAPLECRMGASKLPGEAGSKRVGVFCNTHQPGGRSARGEAFWMGKISSEINCKCWVFGPADTKKDP